MSQITAKNGKDEGSPSATVDFNIGNNLDEAVELYGADVVFKRFSAAVTIDVQALIRRGLDGEKPLSQDEIQAKVDEWKPGVTKARISKKDKALNMLADMSEEDRAEILASLG